MKEIKELTHAEEEVMQILWKLEKGFVKDILEHFPNPKPAYNTVSTIVRILEAKGFVAYTAFGKTHEYFPLISKDEYKKQFMQSMIKNYFGNSYKNMVSFFVDQGEISTREMDELLKEIEKSKSKK